MKAVMVMFDSLNRHMLPSYGCNDLHTPNFKRLQQKSIVFDNSYIGSMPCMPARRELHTGRYNFLHREWGPLEPFDDSMPELLSKNGIYAHLVSDHFHYFEDGGCTYHSRYNSWEFMRGQEGDAWKGEVKDPDIPEYLGHREYSHLWRQDWVNRKYLQNEEAHPTAKTFNGGLEFIHTNKDEDNWFLQIENFSPHEPFFAPQKYRDLYGHDYDKLHFDWPDYAPIAEDKDAVEHCIKEYSALVSMCDEYLGKLLDVFDELNLWDDTMLIVNCDHGYLLGEHNYWGKKVCSNYNEVARTPFFIYDPRHKIVNERRQALIQTIDIAPTILDFFNVNIPKDMLGKPLKGVIENDTPIREGALFGLFGGHINCTDGRYVYMRAPIDDGRESLFNYTLMTTFMASRIPVSFFKDCELVDGFDFTKGCKLLKMRAPELPNKPFLVYEKLETKLFDIENDPKQLQPIDNKEVEEYMKELLIKIMKENDAPVEQYIRMSLN